MTALPTRRFSFGTLLAAAQLAIAAACGPGEIELRPGDELHPNEANAPPADASIISADSLPEGLSAESLQAWKDARDAILGARTVLTLGKRREEGPELFGVLTDVEFDGNGNLVVFDMSTQDVRLFDPDGRHLGGFGGEGEGPMEFRQATRLSVLGDGRVAVPVRRGVKLFVRSDDGWKLDALMAAPVSAIDACADDGGRLFLSDYHRESDAAVHRIPLGEPDGASHFAPVYADDSWIVRWKMSEGLIACAPDLNRVGFAQFATPLVRAYSDDGVLLWTAGVAELTPAPFVENADGGGGHRNHVEHDVLVSINPVPSGHFLLQYGHMRRRRPVALNTYLVDAGTGIGASLGDGLPLIEAVRERGFVAVFRDPYPRLEVREWDVPLSRPAAPPTG